MMQTDLPMWRHGPFRFDPAAKRLTRAGADVPIEPRAMRLLELLLTRADCAVSKSEIFDAVWPGQIVSEASLTKCVARLRAALDDGAHTLIRTIHGHGYRLDSPLVLAPPPLAAAPLPAPAALPPEPAAVPARRWAAARVVLACCAALLVGTGIAASLGTPPRPRSPNAEANRLYLQGLQDWAQRTPASLAAADQEFQRAVAIDPGFARAYAALANTCLLLREFATLPDAEAYARAEAAARRALALDPDLAGAHAALGFVRFWSAWDLAGARQAFDRALVLEPGNATIHHWYATALDAAGEHAAAIAEIDRALELEPGSPAIRADRALLLYDAGRRAEGRAALAALVRANPDFASPHLYLADIAQSEGDNAAYLHEATLWARLRGDTEAEQALAAAATALARVGPAGMAAALLAHRQAAFARGHGDAASLAAAYAAAGQPIQARTYYALAAQRHEAGAIRFSNAGALRDLRESGR